MAYKLTKMIDGQQAEIILWAGSEITKDRRRLKKMGWVEQPQPSKRKAKNRRRPFRPEARKGFLFLATHRAARYFAA